MFQYKDNNDLKTGVKSFSGKSSLWGLADRKIILREPLWQGKASLCNNFLNQLSFLCVIFLVLFQEFCSCIMYRGQGSAVGIVTARGRGKRFSRNFQTNHVTHLTSRQSGFGGLYVACWPYPSSRVQTRPKPSDFSGRKKSSARLPSEGK